MIIYNITEDIFDLIQNKIMSMFVNFLAYILHERLFNKYLSVLLGCETHKDKGQEFVLCDLFITLHRSWHTLGVQYILVK